MNVFVQKQTGSDAMFVQPDKNNIFADFSVFSGDSVV